MAMEPGWPPPGRPMKPPKRAMSRVVSLRVGGRRGRFRGVLAEAMPGLPFIRRQDDSAWQVRRLAALHGQKQDPPGHHRLDREAPTQTRPGFPLARFDATAAFENFG